MHTLFPHSIDKNFLAASGHNFSLLPRAFCVLFSVVSSIFNKHFTRAPPRLFRVKIFALFRTMRSALRAELPVFPSPPRDVIFEEIAIAGKFSALSPRGRAGFHANLSFSSDKMSFPFQYWFSRFSSWLLLRSFHQLFFCTDFLLELTSLWETLRGHLLGREPVWCRWPGRIASERSSISTQQQRNPSGSKQFQQAAHTTEPNFTPQVVNNTLSTFENCHTHSHSKTPRLLWRPKRERDEQPP